LVAAGRSRRSTQRRLEHLERAHVRRAATPQQLKDPAFPAVAFNISTQMDPWFTESAGNPQDGFLQTIEDIIRAEILKQVKAAWRA
jgi:hypothetical protein